MLLQVSPPDSIQDALGQALGPLGWVIGFLLFTLGGSGGLVIRYLVKRLEATEGKYEALIARFDVIAEARLTERAETLTTLQHVIQTLDSVTETAKANGTALTTHDRDVKGEISGVRDEVRNLQSRLRNE